MTVGAAVLGAALLVAGAGASPEGAPRRHSADAGPPDPYFLDGLVTDAMDYPWTATRRVPLFAAPGSHERVGTLAPGDVVTADRLQLRGHPWEVRVIYDRPPFRVGMRMWVLERYMDEGTFTIWYRGERRDDLSDAIEFGPSDEPCGPPSKQCFLRFAKESKQESWFRVKTGRGLVGWMVWDGVSDDFSVGKIKNPAPPGRH
jgi:hypothetical protein